MLSTTKSRTFLHEQLITDSHGPQACEDLHCKEGRKGLTQWHPKLPGGEGGVSSALPGPRNCLEEAPSGQEGKSRAANTRVTVPQPQLCCTSGP